MTCNFQNTYPILTVYIIVTCNINLSYYIIHSARISFVVDIIKVIL